MSQRLAIGQNRDGYDAFVTKDMSQVEIDKTLIDDWVCIRDGYYVGGWKIFIYDVDLFKEVEHQIKDVFLRVGQGYPKCIWAFYADGQSRLVHPSRKSLDGWLKELREKYCAKLDAPCGRDAED